MKNFHFIYNFITRFILYINIYIIITSIVHTWSELLFKPYVRNNVLDLSRKFEKCPRNFCTMGPNDPYFVDSRASTDFKLICKCTFVY